MIGMLVSSLADILDYVVLIENIHAFTCFYTCCGWELQYNTIQYNTIQYNTIQYNKLYLTRVTPITVTYSP
jgi:hypothetical protein